jgi:hypothetical protein
MKPDDHIPQVFPVKVRVYFRGEYGFMSEHLLDRAQVGTTLNQVGGK